MFVGQHSQVLTYNMCAAEKTSRIWELEQGRLGRDFPRAQIFLLYGGLSPERESKLSLAQMSPNEDQLGSSEVKKLSEYLAKLDILTLLEKCSGQC